MDGFKVAQSLREDEQYQNILIIFLTALNDAQNIVKGSQMVPNDFISKPFRKEVLLVRIHHQLSLMVVKRIIVRQTQELQRAVVGRDKLYSVIAHDLHSPMASMQMLLNTIMMSVNKEKVDEDIYDMLKMANKTSDEVFSLLDNLLKWTKSRLGNLNTFPVRLNLYELTQGVIQVFAPVAQVKDISFQLEGVEQAPIFADIEMIKSVLRNLISNAIKFSHKNTTIRVTLVRDSKQFILSVADQGCGIKQSDQHKLLHVGTHFSTYGTNKEEGSGLGLLLCKEFVTRNGGELWFESKGGEGSTFFFSLKAAK